MDSKFIDSDLAECIEHIVAWYTSDTFIFLDKVLTDDMVEPEFSANTVYLRLKNIVRLENLYFLPKKVSTDVTDDDVDNYLVSQGYRKNDIRLLRDKRIYERKRYKLD